MSREFPDYIDPWKAADGRRSFHGTMPLRRMKRLLPLLEGEESELAATGLEVDFSISFSRDRQGLVVLKVSTEGELPLLCQRSLEPYKEQVRRHTRLAVVTRIEDAETIPEHYEPVLVDEGRIALLQVIEDELLLAVPQIPRNPEVAVVDMSTGGDDLPLPVGEERTHRPFAGLAGLMKNGPED